MISILVEEKALTLRLIRGGIQTFILNTKQCDKQKPINQPQRFGFKNEFLNIFFSGIDGHTQGGDAPKVLPNERTHRGGTHPQCNPTNGPTNFF